MSPHKEGFFQYFSCHYFLWPNYMSIMLLKVYSLCQYYSECPMTSTKIKPTQDLQRCIRMSFPFSEEVNFLSSAALETRVRYMGNSPSGV